ncbi:MAG: DUF2283 domain-containing protein [Candidatus Woesearchaeota archaeon]
MAKTDAKIMYDEEEDILTLTKRRKTKASLDIGDFIIDVDAKNHITGLEILNASENLKIPGEGLKTVQQATMTVTYKPRHATITLIMHIAGKEKDITIPLAAELGRGTVTTENTRFAAART